MCSYPCGVVCSGCVFRFAARIREKKRRAVREKEMLEDLDELVKYREELEKEMLEMVRLKKLVKLKR